MSNYKKIESFYSIVYVMPKSANNERISVGLLLVAEGLPIFKYSENKLSLIEKYIGKDTVAGIKNTLKIIKSNADDIRAGNQLTIFDIDYFSSEYIEYINSYYNNLLHFTSPKYSAGDFNLKDFKNLFALFIDNITAEKSLESPKKNFNKLIQNRIKRSKIKSYVDVFYTLPSNLIPSVYDNHKVDFIGYNGSIISGNSLDFQREAYYVERDLYTLKVITSGLDEFLKKEFGKKPGIHFLYINDPIEERQKKIFKNAKRDDTLKLSFRNFEDFYNDEKWILKKKPHRFSSLLDIKNFEGDNSQLLL